MNGQLHGQWYRGGTSKCWLFMGDEMPTDRAQIAHALTAAFGSGDDRQLNGVGGASSTTSKAAIISPSAIPGIDISYLFAQVGIGRSAVEFTSNCGNCASAVALFAIQNGLVRPTGDLTTVRMINENTRSVLAAEVATPGRTVPTDGSETIPGSTMPGIPVDVCFEGVDGTSTGELLPTGKPVETLPVGSRTVTVTGIDAGAPACFVAAADLGMTGTETQAEMRLRLPELIGIRELASAAMGLTLPGEEVSPAVPKVGILGQPCDYTTTTGERIDAADYDVAVRMVSMFDPHPAIGITSAIAAARAAFVEGSLVRDLIDPDRLDLVDGYALIRLGTPVGVVACRVQVDSAGDVIRLGIRRVARRIANAAIDLPEIDLAATHPESTLPLVG